ncbi:hypothetical protein BDA96_02G220300 [Sorghum bicolor]|uniref:Uncharacterized protein n=1 Tax=Sorghum bicolor TaxID=4558 RepID=A0A921RQ69_SORBI|nr:hypothetical protein BDA96_02G220300 [Sorghum bicolor]
MRQRCYDCLRRVGAGSGRAFSWATTASGVHSRQGSAMLAAEQRHMARGLLTVGRVWRRRLLMRGPRWRIWRTLEAVAASHLEAGVASGSVCGGESPGRHASEGTPG